MRRRAGRRAVREKVAIAGELAFKRISRAAGLLGLESFEVLGSRLYTLHPII